MFWVRDWGRHNYSSMATRLVKNTTDVRPGYAKNETEDAMDDAIDGNTLGNVNWPIYGLSM